MPLVFRSSLCVLLPAWLVILVLVASGASSETAGSAGAESRIAMLEAQLEANPADLRLAMVLGGMLARAGEPEQALAAVERSMAALREQVERQGDSSELQYLLGTGSLFLREYEAALNHFQLALSLDPEREKIHLGYVRALLNLGRVEEARMSLDLAVTLFPESEVVKSQLAEIHERSGDLVAAIPYLEELRALNPRDTGVFDRLLRAYVETGAVAQAAPMFEELVEAGAITEMEGLIHVYRMHLEAGNIREARRILQQASQLDEDHPLVADAFMQYYMAQAEQAEADANFRRAVLYWERAVEKGGDAFRPKYRLARAKARLDDHEAALDLYLPLLENKPADPEFYAHVALTLIALEQYKSAERVIELGMRLAKATEGGASAEARLRAARERLDLALQALNPSPAG